MNNLSGVAPKERSHLAAGGSPQSRCFIAIKSRSDVRKVAIRLRSPLRGFGYQVKLNRGLPPRGYMRSPLRG
jgi:hypothetical protein